MIQVDDIMFQGGSREERLPCYDDDFPYVATRVVFDDGTRHGVPWHWHRAVEVFWIRSGSLEYSTPDSSMVFRTGECGFLNSNVLHMTNASSGRTVQMLHLFDPVLISGSPDSLIATRYVLPVIAGGRDMLLMPEGSDQNAAIRKAFSIDPGTPCYEMRIRNMMSDIWMSIMSLVQADGKSREAGTDVDERLKTMMPPSVPPETAHHSPGVSDRLQNPYGLPHAEGFQVDHRRDRLRMRAGQRQPIRQRIQGQNGNHTVTISCTSGRI